MENWKQNKTELVSLDSVNKEQLLEEMQNLPVPSPKTLGGKKLTENQMKIAFLVASQPHTKMTVTEMCDIVGITRSAYYKMIRKPELMSYIEELLDQRNKQFMGVVYNELQSIIVNSRSEKNKLEAIKIYLGMTGKLKTTTEVTHVIKEEQKLDDLEKEVLELEFELLGEELSEE